MIFAVSGVFLGGGGGGLGMALDYVRSLGFSAIILESSIHFKWYYNFITIVTLILDFAFNHRVYARIFQNMAI